jgi:hypothetical protein
VFVILIISHVFCRVELYLYLFTGSSSVPMADALAEGPDKDGQPSMKAKVAVDSVDVVSVLEATFVCLTLSD